MSRSAYLVEKDGSPNDENSLTLHDVSPPNLLIESQRIWSVDEQLEVVLPGFGRQQVRIVWQSGQFYGCQFVSTALERQSQPATFSNLPKKGSPQAVRLATNQLRELSMAIERISGVIDRAVGSLSGKRRP